MSKYFCCKLWLNCFSVSSSFCSVLTHAYIRGTISTQDHINCYMHPYVLTHGNMTAEYNDSRLHAWHKQLCLLTKKHRHWPGSLVRLAWCGIPRVPAPPLVTALHMTQWHTFPVLSCSRRPYPRTHTHTVIALLVSCFSAESQHTFAEAQIYEEASQRNWVCRLVNGTIHNAVKCCLKRKWWRRTRMCDVFLSHASFICFSRFNFSNSTNEATFFFFF